MVDKEWQIKVPQLKDNPLVCSVVVGFFIEDVVSCPTHLYRCTVCQGRS